MSDPERGSFLFSASHIKKTILEGEPMFYGSDAACSFFAMQRVHFFFIQGEVYIELHLVSGMGTKTLDFLLRLFQVMFQTLDACFQ